MDAKDSAEIKAPRKRRRVRVGDPDFTPPDGGWGWMIVLAAGFSNLSTFPMFQQFGLLFRDKFNQIGITSSQTTTVINLNSALNACVGLFNGPVYRRFSYRQVSFTGAVVVSISLLLSSFCESFIGYIIFYSIFYGAGIGLAQAANALALNTYFKKRRRVATGFSWTATALGPIIVPHVITVLLDLYGMEGTLIIFSAFAGHAIMCSLLLQPVHWHTKYHDEDADAARPMITIEKDAESGYFEDQSHKRKTPSLFSSQYLYNEDDRLEPGYEIISPGTPMMLRANDGWYSRPRSLVGSRLSLASNKTSNRESKSTSTKNLYSLSISTRPSYNNLADAKSKRASNANLAEVKKRKISRAKIEESAAEDCPSEKAPQDLKDEEKQLMNGNPDEQANKSEKDVLKEACLKLEEYVSLKRNEGREMQSVDGAEKSAAGAMPAQEAAEEKTSFLQKVVIFFDLDLLKDFTYVNLMLGVTLASFAELNFSILTPFVLGEFNFTKHEVAMFMSLLGAVDISVRFFIPFLAGKIGWENNTFFLFGVLSMALGRIILVHTQTYAISLGVAVLIGFGKGLRTVFMALVIPSHVPLERLPAASGLQLLTSGILFLAMGPVVGWVRDIAQNYVITLHCLNIMTYITAVAWIGEKIFRRKKKTKPTGSSAKQ